VYWCSRPETRQFLSQNFILGRALAWVQGCTAIFRRPLFCKNMRDLLANRLPRIVRMAILGQELDRNSRWGDGQTRNVRADPMDRAATL
jgi:hypothetical protein